MLSNAVSRCLDNVGIMYCGVLNTINMAQVFLWMQEKSLFGMSILLHNPSPGVPFSTADLVRNLLMSFLMNKDISEQEREYRRLWLDPVEIPLQGSDGINKLIIQYLDRCDAMRKRLGEYRRMGSLERYLFEAMKGAPMALKAKMQSAQHEFGMDLYSRFHSLLEEVQLKGLVSERHSRISRIKDSGGHTNMLPPRPVRVRAVAKKADKRQKYEGAG